MAGTIGLDVYWLGHWVSQCKAAGTPDLTVVYGWNTPGTNFVFVQQEHHVSWCIMVGTLGLSLCSMAGGEPQTPPTTISHSVSWFDNHGSPHDSVWLEGETPGLTVPQGCT